MNDRNNVNKKTYLIPPSGTLGTGTSITITEVAFFDMVDKLPIEFFDVVKVLNMGAAKHGDSNWLEPDGNKSSLKAMHDSMFHHLAESWAQGKHGFMDIDKGEEYRHDAESKLDPLLHLACRALMVYTRLQRGIFHKKDT